MGFDIHNILKNFHIIGVSYSRTSIKTRELFSVSTESQKLLLKDAKSLSLDGVVILSTCNRTEIYAHTENIDLIKRLLVKHSKGSLSLLDNHGYHLQGEEAVKHLYYVAAGLDSQILGDFQIVGQLKNAYREAEKKGVVNTLLNRIFSHVFQASKKIKNQTELSNGAASVSYATVQYIRKHIKDLNKVNFLLYGTGEIGKITCANLLRYMESRNLTLINRSEEKAATLAEKYNIKHKPVSELNNEIAKADVIIVATGANKPTVKETHFTNSSGNKLILDLSIPRNVAPEVEELPFVTLANVDELSQVSDEVLQIREESIPLAKKIIEENYQELQQWIEMQHLSPIFEGLKKGLFMLKEQELAYHQTRLTEEEFEKVDFIATNIVNRIAKMGILHIKDVFKNEKSTVDMLAKMFGQYAMKPNTKSHTHRTMSTHKKHS